MKLAHMKAKKVFWFGVVQCICLLYISNVEAEEYGHLQSHEPIYIGYTWTEGDKPFMDFKLSLKYPILHSGKPQQPVLGFLPRFYFSFTGRFGQYIKTRKSSPVISKRFNPELAGRYWFFDKTGGNSTFSHLDILFGHESNGQSVTDPDTYLAKQKELLVQGENTKYADDYISRGWDYVGLLWTRNWYVLGGDQPLITFLKLRYYLDDGLLQGTAEEYNDWENQPDGKPRRKVDGISISFKRNINFRGNWVRSAKLYLEYDTGIDVPFRYNTVRAELALTTGNLPLMLWINHGYNNDLAHYYRNLTAGGIAIEFLGM